MKRSDNFAQPLKHCEKDVRATGETNVYPVLIKYPVDGGGDPGYVWRVGKHVRELEIKRVDFKKPTFSKYPSPFKT